MTSEAKKEGLPTWAKILIGLVVTGFVCFAAVLVLSIWCYQKAEKESKDPAAVVRHLQDIASFPQPLPDGYKPVTGFGFIGMSMVMIEHLPDKQVMILFNTPAKGEEDTDALAKKLYDAGISSPGATVRFQVVKGQGKETIAGAPLSYIIGQTTDKDGAKVEGLVGCISAKDKSKTVVIYGIEPPGNAYNLDETMNFLKTIKGF